MIEAVSGLHYNQYVQEHILHPLGLASTGPELVVDVFERCVTGYTGNVLGVPRRGVPTIDTRALSPATGFYSTAEDLCRFAAAHWPGDESLLSDAAKREMQHAAWTVEQSEERYGLGFIAERIGERETVGHSGGFRASRRARSSTRSTSWWWWSSATPAATMGAPGRWPPRLYVSLNSRSATRWFERRPRTLRGSVCERRRRARHRSVRR